MAFHHALRGIAVAAALVGGGHAIKAHGHKAHASTGIHRTAPKVSTSHKRK
jgi:hypothetical protein